MTTPREIHNDALRRAAQLASPGAALLRAWPLKGGVSAEITALEVAGPGGERRLVLRRYGAADLAANPRVAAAEHAVLRTVRAAGIPAPEPLALDESGAILPTPFLVEAFVDGETELDAPGTPERTRQLAELLARLHEVDPSGLNLLPRRMSPDAPDATLAEPPVVGRIRDALRAAGPPPPARPALLHGDYWPGNVLWRAGRIAAVVDWEDAALGDPLADLAGARLEALWLWGEDAMQRFTEQYGVRRPAAELARWDLWAAAKPALRLGGWGLAPDDEAAMRDRLEWFVARALNELAEL